MQIKILGISEKQRIKLDIFVNFLKKKYFFYTLKQTNNNFFDFILPFWGVRYFWIELCIFSKLPLLPTNSCFASLKAISDRALQTILHTSMNYWFQYSDLH